uniref:Uncharacterized protein n=1 Tax=viral metagenome TaxID=1070528 RepID=A0A6C0IRA1_9ZZZZ
MDNSEFVFTQSTDENGNKIFIGGGYKIESYFLKAGQPIMTTFNDDQEEDLEKNTFSSIQDGGKKVTSPFENLAVPAGIFYVNQKIAKSDYAMETHYNDNHGMISEDIHDKLLALVQPSHNAKRNNHNKKTRKHITQLKDKKEEPAEKVSKKKKTRRRSK